MIAKTLKSSLNHKEVSWSLNPMADGWSEVKMADKSFYLRVLMKNSDYLLLDIKGHGLHKVPYFIEGAKKYVSVLGRNFEVSPFVPNKKAQAPTGDLKAPMTGKVVKILVTTGTQVKAGQVLVILEAMKMEHVVKAPRDGVIEKVLISEGTVIQGGEELVVLSKEKA
jgi:biotin carboxyl carrier protein